MNLEKLKSTVWAHPSLGVGLRVGSWRRDKHHNHIMTTCQAGVHFLNPENLEFKRFTTRAIMRN